MTETLITPWRYYALDQSAGAVALVFCELMLPGRHPGTVYRYWEGSTLRGWFHPSGGGEKFTLKGTPDGWWEVRREGE